MNRAEAIRFYTDKLAEATRLDGTNGYREAQRWLARNDLFYLLVGVLRRRDVNRDWLFDRCREVAAEPDGCLDLWARDHYKSSIITFGLTIQDVLNDPEVTVGIFSHTRSIAKGFLSQIKREFELNETLHWLFPDILWDVPGREAPKWSLDDVIIVKRRRNPKEATVVAWGLVDGQPTGKHFALLIYDDVVTRESVTTPEMIRKVTDAWALSLNLGTRTGKRRTIGTRYHFNDTYREMIRRGSVRPRVHPATVDGTVDGEPVLLGREQLAAKRRDMGPYVFGCQMLQDPKADEVQGFKTDWVRTWSGQHWSRMNRYILVDPASKKKPGSDYTTLQVVGLGEDRNYYWITGIRDRLSLTERGTALITMHREYQPVGVGYEEYGLQADIEFVEHLQETEQYRFRITALGGPLAKAERIRRLVPILEQGRWYMPASHVITTVGGERVDVVPAFIEDELDPFPVGTHDDLIDGAARILDDALKAQFPKPLGAARTGPKPERANSSYRRLR